MKNFGLAPDEAAERRRWAMECVGLAEALLTRDPANLSFGERRKVALASVIALKPKYLILDEPLAGLDWHGRRHLTETITRLTSEGLTTVILTHETDLVAEVGDKVSVLDHGHILGPMPPEAFLSSGRADPGATALEADSSPWAGLLPDFALAIHKVRAHGHLLPALPRRIEDAVGRLVRALSNLDG